MGVGVSALVPLIVLFGAFFGGCGRCFGVSWVICRLGEKLGSKSILRLQNSGVGFGVGFGFPVGGLVGCRCGVSTLSSRLLATAETSVLAISRLTVSNCGWGLPKVLQQLRQGFRRRLSVFGGACNGGGVVWRSRFRRFPCCLSSWLGVWLWLSVDGCRPVAV